MILPFFWSVNIVEPATEFNSIWIYVSLAGIIPLFFYYLNVMEKVKDNVYPKIVTHRGYRQLFDGAVIILGLALFLSIWGYAINAIYL